MIGAGPGVCFSSPEARKGLAAALRLMIGTIGERTLSESLTLADSTFVHYDMLCFSLFVAGNPWRWADQRYRNGARLLTNSLDSITYWCPKTLAVRPFLLTIRIYREQSGNESANR
jgi:hypothetical protein